VNPRISTRIIIRRRKEGVGAVRRVSHGAAREGIGYVWGVGWQSIEGNLRGQQADRFTNDRLEETAKIRVHFAMRRQCLTEVEECGHSPRPLTSIVYLRTEDRHSLVLKADIVTCETPSMVCWIECVFEWENTPY